MTTPDHIHMERLAPLARKRHDVSHLRPLTNGLGGLLFRANQHLERCWAGLEHSDLKINGDRWTYYLRRPQSPEGSYIILLHGFTAEASHWFRFARRLDRGQGLIIPDLPGFGTSTSSPNASYSIPEQSRRLTSFLDILGLEGQLHLVGSSMGGHIALEYALQHPERVASLTLIGSGGITSPQPSAATITTNCGDRSPFEVATPDDFATFLQYCMKRPPWMPALVRNYLAARFIALNRHHQAILPQIISADLRDEELHQIEVPTLIVWGDEDRLLHPSMAMSFHVSIRGSECCLMDGIGHLPFVEAPTRTARRYTDFLRRRTIRQP